MECFHAARIYIFLFKIRYKLILYTHTPSLVRTFSFCYSENPQVKYKKNIDFNTLDTMFFFSLLMY